MDSTVKKLQEVIDLLGVLIEKTDHTNQLLKTGIKTQFGHNMSTLEMDPDRFRKSEEERGTKFPHQGKKHVT